MPGREASLAFCNHLPPPPVGVGLPPAGRANRLPRLPRPPIAKEWRRDENALARELGALIATLRGLQGFFHPELENGRGPTLVEGRVGIGDRMDGADHELVAVRPREAPGAPAIPFAREAGPPEDDPRPSEEIVGGGEPSPAQMVGGKKA